MLMAKLQWKQEHKGQKCARKREEVAETLHYLIERCVNFLFIELYWIHVYYMN